MKLYKSYVFRTKDPVIDELRGFIDHETRGVYRRLSNESGVSHSAIHNWFKGTTKRPQSASIEAVGRAIGVKRVWVRIRKKEKSNAT
jgi:hypothetical protein